MYSFSPIQGTKSIFLLKFHGTRILEYDTIISGMVLFSHIFILGTSSFVYLNVNPYKVTEEVMRRLMMLARERGVEEARDKMFDGGHSHLHALSHHAKCCVLFPFLFHSFQLLLLLNSAQTKFGNA